MAEQLMPLPPHPMTMPCRRNASYEISKNPPNQNSIPMQTSIALFVANSKLSANAHLFWICPEDWRGRYILFFIITCEIITSWRSLSSFMACPRGLKHNVEHNRFSAGDEFYAQLSQFFAFRKYFIFFSINLLPCCASPGLKQSLLCCTSALYISPENSCMLCSCSFSQCVLRRFWICILLHISAT